MAFSGSGLVTQEPTTDKATVLAAIDRLTPQGGTALGERAADGALAIVGRPVLLDSGPATRSSRAGRTWATTGRPR